MKTTHSVWRVGATALILATALSSVQAKSVAADGALPVVELMPLTMKHEADLKFSPEQIKSLEDYRKQAAPGRMAVQKKTLTLRGQLRMAILEGRSPAERETLMRQIAEAEIDHFKGRERCVEHIRTTLSAEQYRQLVDLYLAGLR